MEPTIYKPSIYKGSGIYKSEGIYNGAGIYKARGVITIGNIDYSYIEINGLYWITENIRNETLHYINPENASKENGKLYQARYLNEIIDILPTGWRIPSQDDFISLALSSNSDDFITKNLGGNDIFGFNLYLPGYRNKDNNFVYNEERSVLWSVTEKDETHLYTVKFIKNDSVDFYDWSLGSLNYLANTALSVRVCKDT